MRALARSLALVVIIIGASAPQAAFGDSPSAPLASADAYVTPAGVTLEIDSLAGVLANDSDPDGDIILVREPQASTTPNGSLVLREDGSFSYTPAAGFEGTDSFTYRATDGDRDSDPATVTIVVDDPPLASADAYTTKQGRAVTADIANGVLTNDSDPNGDPISAVLESGTSGGTLGLEADGTFTYVPGPAFVGEDTFTYRATDGTLDSDSATVSITVLPDAAPIANDDSYGPIRGGSGLHANVLRNDSDSDAGDIELLEALQVSEPRFGSADLAANGDLVYRPLPGVCNRTDRFTYRATDGVRESGIATVTIPVRTRLQPTTLSLRPSVEHITYGRSVRLLAHLSALSPSARISIFGTPAGGHRTLLARGRPDASGTVEIRVRPGRSTTYRAVSTDNCFEHVTTPARAVAVAPAVAGAFVAPFGHRGSIALYHSGGRAPHYRATVTPSHPAGPVRFVWQRRSGGQWGKYYTSGTLHLKGSSAIDVYLTGGVMKGVPYRVKVVFLGDRDHLARAGSWSPFMAV